ncbi:MAG: 4-alpha-glucanotransferase [Proteobacteria bacterium]|nr:MAG: 4-alpha-glucanotransferase [Pseudomonadota bacterium]
MNDDADRAGRWGIQTQYWDALGQHRVADSEALAKMIEAVSGNSAEAGARLLPQTCVVRRGREARVTLDVAPGHSVSWNVFSGKLDVSGNATSPNVVLPTDLTVGGHRLRVTVQCPDGNRSGEAVLLVAPERAWQGEEAAPRRLWALAVQLYGVRSRRNWGHGDFSDLAALIDLAADLGAAGIGLNPLHALFDDRAEASPYSPNSRLFLNPRYIDVEAIPEFPGLAAAGLEQEIEALRQQELVDYKGVVAVKLKALRLAYDAFRRHGEALRQREFDTFRRNRSPLLAHFACFESLRSHYEKPWWDWPLEWRKPNENFLRRLRSGNEEEIGFVEFVQWVAHQQLDLCKEHARQRGLAVGLYLDIAVGVRAEGFDAWSEQGAVLSTVEIGAPPDMLNTAGQKWGLAGVNPVGLEARAFEPFRRVLRASMRYAGAIRLDHVMGLQRQFLVPSGMKADRGMYVRSPFDALLAITAQESVDNRCIVIGEDLGTVPENFRETLADWGMWSYQVMVFERLWGGAFREPQDYRANALATFATHDMPTFAGWLASKDLEVKRALGIDPGETDDDRRAALAALNNALFARALPDSQFLSVVRYLAATPSRLVVVSMEDVLGVTEQVNVPGTVDEHPNWRRRLPVALEDLAGDARLTAVADAMAERKSGTGRQ